MIGLHPDCPSDVSMLADHLDTALAVGEEMLACSLPPRSDLDDADPETAPGAIDVFVRRLMQLEASFLLRVLRARRLAASISRADLALKSACDLFRIQTEVLHELIQAAGEGAEGQLARAGDGHAYIRSRGLIAPEAAAPSPFESVVVGEEFRIGGVAAIGQMLDMVSALLDLLDARYGLYSPDPWDGDTATDAHDSASALDIASEMDAVAPDAAGIAEADPTGAAGDTSPPEASSSLVSRISVMDRTSLSGSDATIERGAKTSFDPASPKTNEPF